MLEWVSRERDERNQRMAEMMAAAGYDISLEALERTYPGAVLGRPHFCDYLVRQGVIASVEEGFATLLGVGCPFFLPKRRIPIARAAEVIRETGGVPVLAHPLQYGYRGQELQDLADTARDVGIRHLEAYYSEHSEADERQMLSLARKMGFGVTGGSDFHGSRKPYIHIGSGTGRMTVPYSVLEDLKAWRDAHRA